MARTRASYSESHDYSKYPPKGKRRAQAPAPYVPGPPPNTNVGFLPKNLSDEQRRELRARQLAAAQNPNMPWIHGPLDDHDLTDPGDATPRGQYPNRFSPVPATVQVVNGPQDYARTEVHPLLEREIHPPTEFDTNSRVRAGSDVESALELIAAVSADDRDILAFDNKMSDAHMALRNLRQAADRLVRSVRLQDERKGQEGSPTAHAQNLLRLLSTVIEPWFNVLEGEFDALLNGTTQVLEMEGEEA